MPGVVQWFSATPLDAFQLHPFAAVAATMRPSTTSPGSTQPEVTRCIILHYLAY